MRIYYDLTSERGNKNNILIDVTHYDNSSTCKIDLYRKDEEDRLIVSTYNGKLINSDNYVTIEYYNFIECIFKNNLLNGFRTHYLSEYINSNFNKHGSFLRVPVDNLEMNKRYSHDFGVVKHNSVYSVLGVDTLIDILDFNTLKCICCDIMMFIPFKMSIILDSEYGMNIFDFKSFIKIDNAVFDSHIERIKKFLRNYITMMSRNKINVRFNIQINGTESIINTIIKDKSSGIIKNYTDMCFLYNITDLITSENMIDAVYDQFTDIQSLHSVIPDMLKEEIIETLSFYKHGIKLIDDHILLDDFTDDNYKKTLRSWSVPIQLTTEI